MLKKIIAYSTWFSMLIEFSFLYDYSEVGKIYPSTKSFRSSLFGQEALEAQAPNLNSFKASNVSPVLINFMLKVYRIKSHKTPRSFDIPEYSLRKVKRSDIVQYLTLKGDFKNFH